MLWRIRRPLWIIITKIYPFYLKKFYGMDISLKSVISYKAKLDKSVNPKGIHIGDYTYVLADSIILSHDWSRNLETDTFIGNNCIIGIRSIILPGIKIGDHSVIGAGSVVTRDVPPHTVVAGNPARVIRDGVSINDKGQIISGLK
jgi:acetyltransferase-like isoleucine patch superfamily enzyme